MGKDRGQKARRIGAYPAVFKGFPQRPTQQCPGTSLWLGLDYSPYTPLPLFKGGWAERESLCCGEHVSFTSRCPLPSDPDRMTLPLA